jgi:RimJ/RimL family protein N-acetyltransferase
MSELVPLPMTYEVASEIAQWRYPAPFDRYNMRTGNETYMSDPANRFLAIFQRSEPNDALVAFASRGRDGQVPGYDYDDSAVDFGFAMNPAFRGQRLSALAIEAALCACREHDGIGNFRATVWSGNARMLNVLDTLGFSPVARFTKSGTADEYIVLTSA